MSEPELNSASLSLLAGPSPNPRLPACCSILTFYISSSLFFSSSPVRFYQPHELCMIHALVKESSLMLWGKKERKNTMKICHSSVK